jgi:hypothetical protein
MNSILEQTVRRGDTSVIWRVGHKDENGDFLSVADGSGYACKVKIKDTAIPVRTVTARDADQKVFLVALLPAETDLLVAGRSYTVAIQIDNTTLIPQLSREKWVDLYVTEAAI